MAVAASDRSPERLAVLRQLLANWRGPGTLVVVTHALTVQALVGIMPAQAETVVVRPKLGKEPGTRWWAGSPCLSDFLSTLHVAVESLPTFLTPS
jgi:hypothetical protein